MADSKRMDRLQEQMRQCLAEIIQRKLKNPQVGMVSVTAVELARDLSDATVYYSVFGDANTRRNTNRVLENARGFMQSELGKMLHIRKIPSLHFRIDKSLERGQRIYELLDGIKTEDDKSKSDD
jgi:ribosome-binding factor A